MKTKFSYVLSGPMSKVQNNEDSTLICHSLKCAAEISDSDSILQKTIENFWEMKSFDSKADNFTVYKSFSEDICCNSNEARYEVRLPFKDDHEILPDNFTHWEHRLSNSAKKLSKNSDLLHAYNEIVINQLNTNIIEPNLETVFHQGMSITSCIVQLLKIVKQTKSAWFMMPVQMLLAHH